MIWRKSFMSDENKMKNDIDVKSVRELLPMKFFIPDYQRGYRWETQQVEDLLNDIYEFLKSKPVDYEFYCLQPLVVRKMSEDEKVKNNLDEAETWYEVIDGQQRLTTVYLIFLVHQKILKLYDDENESSDDENIYELKYQRDINRENYLDQIAADNFDSKNIDSSSIDHFNMCNAFRVINKWFSNNKLDKLTCFKNALLSYEPEEESKKDKANNVRFIWYESKEENPIKVFTRLNIGKISLTNAELIKALFLNSSNFAQEKNNQAEQNIRLRQQEIASEWDNIEYTLQNDEFWLFLNRTGYDKPTRIDMIFDLICENKKLGEVDVDIGKDAYKTFRYFYECFKKGDENDKGEKKIKEIWDVIKDIFQIFREWYDDLELYHYIGYLIDQKTQVKELVEKWENVESKEEFVRSLKEDIKSKLQVKIKGKIYYCNDLSQQYEFEGGPDKTKCRPLLLLHNVQTVINQGKNAKDKYGSQVFYKFPFHIYKKEGWDIEHIDSNTENTLEDKEDQKEWLLNVYGIVNEKKQQEIKDFLGRDTDDDTRFSKLKDSILNDLKRSGENSLDDNETKETQDQNLDEHEKNQVMNFALLDSSTNRSYGNAIFASKRRIIIEKDSGRLFPIPKKIEELDNFPKENDWLSAPSSFVPPCTRQVFLKYYSPVSTNPNLWTKFDAEKYRKNILNTLKDFGVK